LRLSQKRTPTIVRVRLNENEKNNSKCTPTIARVHLIEKRSQTMENQLFAHSEILDLPERAEYATEGIVSKKIIQKDTGNVTLFAFDKGQKLSEHSAPFDALVQVLEGRAEIKINSKPFVVEAGKAIIMPANVPHAVDAIEKFKMLLTMIR
jgi:quercetin dioxygenase-like cupin family protein